MARSFDNVLAVRMTPEERALFRAKARILGVTESQLVRQVLRRELGLPTMATVVVDEAVTERESKALTAIDLQDMKAQLAARLGRQK